MWKRESLQISGTAAHAGNANSLSRDPFVHSHRRESPVRAKSILSRKSLRFYVRTNSIVPDWVPIDQDRSVTISWRIRKYLRTLARHLNWAHKTSLKSCHKMWKRMNLFKFLGLQRTRETRTPFQGTRSSIPVVLRACESHEYPVPYIPPHGSRQDPCHGGIILWYCRVAYSEYWPEFWIQLPRDKKWADCWRN